MVFLRAALLLGALPLFAGCGMMGMGMGCGMPGHSGHDGSSEKTAQKEKSCEHCKDGKAADCPCTEHKDHQH